MENQPNEPCNKTCEPALLAFRQQIDEIDEKIISLLVQRMTVIAKVGELKKNNQEKFFIRANREADMIKNLVKKSGELLPKSTIINIWRKIITTANMHEQPLQIAIHNPLKNSAYNYLVKEYYSDLVPLHDLDSANNVILALEKNQAQIAIFVLPKINDEEKKEDLKETWWISLANNRSGLKIFAKLPFFEFSDAKKNPVCPIDIRDGDPRKAGRDSCRDAVSRRDKGQKNNDQIELVAVAAKNSEKSSEDNSFLYVEVAKEISKTQILSALKEQNLSAEVLKSVVLRQVEGIVFYLIELYGFYEESDEAIKNFSKSKIKPYVKILGHYALPIKI